MLRGDLLNTLITWTQQLFILSAQWNYLGSFVFNSSLTTCVVVAFYKSISSVSHVKPTLRVTLTFVAGNQNTHRCHGAAEDAQ